MPVRSPDDIDFTKLRPAEFEELCFDLLMELGFLRLVWRQGGADSGRDIQGIRRVDPGVVDAYEETWFFECKRYEGGVPPEVLNSKVVWADAERPKHLLFFVSSYITNNARTWLDAIGRDKPYRIHLVEGKQLQQLVTRSRPLISRYFSTPVQQLMVQAHRAWIHHNLIPEPWLLRTLAEADNLSQYEPGQLAFLWASLKIRFEELNANMENSWGESYDVMFSILKQHANCDRPVLSAFDGWSLIEEKGGSSDHDVVYRNIYAAQAAHLRERREYLALFCLVSDDEGEGLEVLVDQDSSLTYFIRHLPDGARGAIASATQKLRER